MLLVDGESVVDDCELLSVADGAGVWAPARGEIDVTMAINAKTVRPVRDASVVWIFLTAMGLPRLGDVSILRKRRRNDWT